MKKLITICAVVTMYFAQFATAVPVDPYIVDTLEQDQLLGSPYAGAPQYHELGTKPAFPDDEWIMSGYTYTEQTVCDGPPYNDPLIPDAQVVIQNMTGKTWGGYNQHHMNYGEKTHVYYVADPETSLSNYDGYMGNAGLGDAQKAFIIDSVGMNRPLIFESKTYDDIFEPGEVWYFIIQDFYSAGWAPNQLGSIGIASLSIGDPYYSTGSIVASVPEPATIAMLGLGALSLLRKRKK